MARTIIDGRLLCTLCRERLPLTEFTPREHSKIGYANRCRTCARDWYLRRDYGITAVDYRALLNKQGGVCKICERPPTAEKLLAVDHCHDTGKVRGLLCHLCNNLLGCAQDNIDTLTKAIQYLRKAGAK